MTEKKRNIIGIIVFLLFLGMFIYGSTTSEVGIVMKKAINICLECIGLGG